MNPRIDRAWSGIEPKDGFERARALAFERALDATIEQRLAWLEEMLEIARASGALGAAVERRHRESNQSRLGNSSK